MSLDSRIERRQTSIDRPAVAVPSCAPGFPGPLLTLVFARLGPQLIISSGDAEAFILANLKTETAVSRRRARLALLLGKHGRKSWSGNASDTEASAV